MTSVHRFWLALASGVGVLTFVASATLLAQPRGGRLGGPRYDTSTEATVTGTVESVEQITGRMGGRGRRGMGGTHLTLKTSSETLEVHLGPTVFLNEQKVTVAKGDTPEIVGSRVKVDDEQVLIAKSVKKGSDLWTLRDAQGLPLWKGTGGRR